MPENSINGLIENLTKILNKNSEDIADVLQLLGSNEKAELKTLFSDYMLHSKTSAELYEVSLKADAIGSLIYVLQNNPQLNEIINNSKRNSNDKEDILKKLSNIAFELYFEYFETIKGNDYLDDLATLVLTSFYAITADKQTISDIVVKENIKKYSMLFNDGASHIRQLHANTYIILLKITSKINNRNELIQLSNLINDNEKLLQKLQTEELEKEELNLEDAIRISVLAVVNHIAKTVKSYLFTGKLENDDLDIYSFIDTYSYNTIKLMNSLEDKNLKKIVNQLKYALQQICRNSIWSVAEKNPEIKKFFDSCLNSNNNLLYTLLPTQRDSILDILTTKRSIVLNMPTSSGKSLLAELYILFTRHNYSSGDQKPTICYVVPTNALINQVCRNLKRDFSEFKFNIETVLPFYDIDEIEEEILKNKTIDILVSTPEKLDLLIRKSHEALKNLRLVIIDEAHNIGDESRGSKFELLLATIKQRRRNVNFLLLSPFISNAKSVAKWLGDTDQDSTAISLNWSPTKQYIGCNLLNKDKTESCVLYYPTDRNNIIKDPVEVDLELNPRVVKEMIGERNINYTKSIILIDKYLNLGTVLVICEGPGSSEKLSEKCLKYFQSNNRLENISQRDEIRKVIELIKLETSDEDNLIKCLEYGIVYHHARLSALIKDEIEKLICIKGLIKIVCATTTLAQGMNFPITTVVFDTLKIGGGKKIRKLYQAEFWNIAGRAGRAYMDREGHIITPYTTDPDITKENALKYIQHGVKELLSSLNEFFKSLPEEFKFDYDFLQKHPAASNFLQYLNHIVNVAYNYKIDSIDIAKIRSMLSSSLVYKELLFKAGFLESQEKITNFAYGYIKHLKGEKNTGNLMLADMFGVSDISFKKINSLVIGYRYEVISQYGESKKDDFMKASKIILESRDSDKLTRIIKIISALPEIKMDLTSRGEFNPESVAKIVIGWVNGDKVSDIAREILYKNEDYKDILGKCFHFVNSKMKSFIPWGMSIYQQLTDDTKAEKATNLPSYIYYGVNDDESVILSKVGVPRFAISKVKDILRIQDPYIDIRVNNIDILKEKIKGFEENSYSFEGRDNKLIKKIIDGYL